jgi:ubiquinone/menaquinone biosynthesis C-methylase UbiE
MFWLRRMPPGEPLIVAMAGVRSGDRLLIIGADAPKAIGQLALKPGLNGRTCIVDDEPQRVKRAASLAESEGALVEHQTSSVTAIPYDADSFDVVVVNRLLSRIDPGSRPQCLADVARVLRAGGRCVAVQTARGGGLARLFGGGPAMSASEVEALLTGTGFRAVHTLAEREGLLFVEGAKRS